MHQLVVLGMLACLGAAAPAGLLGDPGAIYGRLQRNSYVPYPKPDYTRLYLALKNARLQDQEPAEQDYEYEQAASRPIGAIFEPQEDAMQYEDGRDDLPSQQWLDIGTLYDSPIDEEGLEQQKEMVRQIMSNYLEKKSESKKAAPSLLPTLKPARGGSSTSTEASATTSASLVAGATTKAPQKVKEHKEDKIPKVSKLHGQKEYAMLRPAGAGEARRPLPDLWPEDAEVQQLKRAARRLLRKPTSALDELTSELDSLKPKKH